MALVRARAGLHDSRALCKEDPLEQTRDRFHSLNGGWQEHECSNYFAQNCKFAESARIVSLKTKMLPHHMSMICTRPLGRIDNVALKRWALFTVE